LAPENTLGGFAKAIACGVDVIELDVGMTADDVLVVSHDPVLNPEITRDLAGAWLVGPGPVIRQATYQQLALFDVGRIRPGGQYAARFPEQVPMDGQRIPTLAAVLELATGVGVNIELKTFPDRPELTVCPIQLARSVADRVGNTPRMMMQSFDWRGLRWLRRHRPEITLGWLTDATVAAPEVAALWWDGKRPQDHGGSIPAAVAAEGGAIWAPEFTTLDRPGLEAAHRLGLRVIPWTVNGPADMARLIAWGVDGLITDRPDLRQEVITVIASSKNSP
jgi:glycerophosphoryl diester phosphodiesterase